MTAGAAFGEYRLIRRLGAGGMAEVFLAKRVGPRGFEKQLVIKRILPHLNETPRFTEMFLAEARLAALIDHPNLVHVSDFGEIDGSFYLAMELVDGLTASEMLKLLGTLPPGVAARITSEVLAALQAIHTARSSDGAPLSLVHRDVSPRNIMISRDGGVKLLDFGIAVQADASTGDTLGTRRYMSPEQLRGETLDGRSDLYSAGAVLFELLSGEPPPGPAPLPPSNIPQDLWRILQPLLAADPRDRPSAAKETQGALELFLATRGVEGTRAHLAELAGELSPNRSRVSRALTRLTRITHLSRPSSVSGGAVKKRPIAIVVGAAAGVGLAIGLVALMERGEPPRSPAPSPVVAAPEAPVVVAPAPVQTASVVAAAPVVEEPAKKKRTVRRVAVGNGKLTIDTQPWTEVYLGGRKLGITPMEGVVVPAGVHELELRNPQIGLVRRVKVNIRPNQVTRVKRTL